MKLPSIVCPSNQISLLLNGPSHFCLQLFIAPRVPHTPSEVYQITQKFCQGAALVGTRTRQGRADYKRLAKSEGGEFPQPQGLQEDLSGGLDLGFQGMIGMGGRGNGFISGNYRTTTNVGWGVNVTGKHKAIRRFFALERWVWEAPRNNDDFRRKRCPKTQ